MGDVRINIEAGSIYGKWTVLGYPEKVGHSTKWFCLCECGVGQMVNGYSLRKGLSSQCTNCKINATLQSPEVKAKRVAGLASRWGNSAAGNSLFATYKVNASKRGYEFALSREVFDLLIAKNCHYCNRPPSNIKNTWMKRHGFILYNGIDRMDNSKGYTEVNSITCCEKCNKAKLKMSYLEFKQWIKDVYNHFGSDK